MVDCGEEMDVVPGDTDSEADLESGMRATAEESSRSPSVGEKAPPKKMLSEIYRVFSDGMIKGEEEVYFISNMPNPSRIAGDCVKLEGEKIADQKKVVKENHKKKINKKPPKPPRPPRSPSLDAADEKLIKEISELAMLKRARIDRMKALKRMKAAKTSSSSPSNGNLFAAVVTIFFCLVILFRGFCSRVSSSSPEGSPVSEGLTNSGIISVHYHGFQPSENNEPGSLSAGSIHRIVGSDPPDILGRAVGQKLKS